MNHILYVLRFWVEMWRLCLLWYFSIGAMIRLGGEVDLDTGLGIGCENSHLEEE